MEIKPSIRMLFQQIYNWIKYKTLPPSVLYKNRLFVERNSKFKRIMNNLGLTFRNSKWTNLEMINIQQQFKLNYLRFLAIMLFLFFMLFSFYHNGSLYIYFPLFNNLIFFVWAGMDSASYYISFFIWLSIVAFASLLNIAYSYFFFNLFSTDIDFQNYLPKTDNFIAKTTKKISNSNSSGETSLSFFPTLQKLNSYFVDGALDKIFESNFDLKIWEKKLLFFHNLYKIIFFFNLMDNNPTVETLNNKPSLINIQNNKLLENFTNFLLYTNIQKNTQNSYIMKNRFKWNIYNIENESKKNSHLINYKFNNFYLYNNNLEFFNFNNVKFSELFALNIKFNEQMALLKQNRWLYRYSILHRHSFKHIHKYTLLKKIFHSGFFDKNFFDKNLWNTQALRKDFFFNKLYTLNNFYYKQLFEKSNFDLKYNKINFLNGDGYGKNLSLLKFYENSYFWFCKRFYLFNNLSNNLYENTFFLKTKSSDIDIKKKNLFLMFLNLLHKQSSFINFFNLNNTKIQSLDYSVETNSDLKTLFLNYNANEFFSKENLSMLLWFTQPNKSAELDLMFFLKNYNNNFDESIFFDKNDFLNNSNLLFAEDFFFYFFTNENKYVNDLYFFL